MKTKTYLLLGGAAVVVYYLSKQFQQSQQAASLATTQQVIGNFRQGILQTPIPYVPGLSAMLPGIIQAGTGVFDTVINSFGPQ